MQNQFTKLILGVCVWWFPPPPTLSKEKYPALNRVKGLLCRRLSGWGSSYIRSMSRTCIDYEDLKGVKMSTLTASWWRGSFFSLQIIPHNDFCLKWGITVPGNLPAMKESKQEGVFGESFTSFWTVTLYMIQNKTCKPSLSIFNNVWQYLILSRIILISKKKCPAFVKDIF